MPDSNTLIEVSAFSGLAGAIITQVINGLLTYYNEKRKVSTQLKTKFRNKKIEIAESFYYVTGETMAVLKKNINFWKNRNDSRSASSLKFLSEEIKKLDTHLETLNSQNWKHNLVALYFNVSLSYNDIIAANSRSHQLYLIILDLADKINRATEDAKEDLYGKYNLSIFDLCFQYEEIYQLLQQDISKVKEELLISFKE